MYTFQNLVKQTDDQVKFGLRGVSKGWPGMAHANPVI